MGNLSFILRWGGVIAWVEAIGMANVVLWMWRFLNESPLSISYK